MSSGALAALALAAVLTFWAVGAHNRLVRQRNAIGTAFAAFEVQLRQRDALLRRWIEALRELLSDSPHYGVALTAAADQLLMAVEVARARPSSEAAIAAVRSAERTLAGARAELASELPALVSQPTLSEASVSVLGLDDQLTAAESTLAFARVQVNLACDEYNAALAQFPTRLLKSLLGFQRAGKL